MNDELPGDDDPDLLIAEYALGVLEEAERRVVEARAANDPQFAAKIAAWQQHFSGWLEAMPAQVPPAQVWSAIERELSAPPQPARRGLWNNPRPLRWMVAASLAASVLLAIGLAWTLSPPAPQPPLTATLQLDDGQSAFTVSIDRSAEHALFIPTAELDLQGRVAQAWVIAPGQAPRSLGLLRPDQGSLLKIPRELLATLTPAAVLAVSLEPDGGSPTGQPTGPVVAKGNIFAL
ncbi:anti-sigma factor [Pseudomonas fontis]|uniref:Regulator of SigK n=1 Tax=Pseudomonas fontis TaxID=2942633 RepID=A0ABT5NNN0_9PSED|nr:anti-sigma factor [Pseudomonas fontis]MDD0973012.1 anti-sigma factor [Pseudomonas fontis]MDD0989781.1 anti-sigma factor [Pseudomonas fontis]